MRRATTLSLGAFAALVLAGFAFVAAKAGGHVEDVVPVQPGELAVPIPPGQEACQAPVDPPADFSEIRLQIATYLRPGPPLTATVHDYATGARLGRGQLAGGYPDNSMQTIETSTVPDRTVRVCLRNEGRSQVMIYGEGGQADPESGVAVDGNPVDADMSIAFLHDRRVPDLLGKVFQRAALFHPQWVGAWTFWLLAAAVVLVVPLLLASAIAGAVRADAEPRHAEGSERA